MVVRKVLLGVVLILVGAVVYLSGPSSLAVMFDREGLKNLHSVAEALRQGTAKVAIVRKKPSGEISVRAATQEDLAAEEARTQRLARIGNSNSEYDRAMYFLATEEGKSEQWDLAMVQGYERRIEASIVSREESIALRGGLAYALALFALAAGALAWRDKKAYASRGVVAMVLSLLSLLTFLFTDVLPRGYLVLVGLTVLVMIAAGVRASLMDAPGAQSEVQVEESAASGGKES